MGKVHRIAPWRCASKADALAEVRVSYQAHIFVCDLRGVTRGEKAVLQIIARYHDHRTGIARVSRELIAADAEMSERHVITLLRQIEAARPDHPQGILVSTRSGCGRG